MPVVIGCLTPHPPIIIPDIGRDNLNRVTSTKDAMLEVAGHIALAEPDALVFISPHSAGLADSIAVRANPVLEGSFADFGAPEVRFSKNNDLAFIEALITAANDFDLSVTKVGHGHIDLMGSDELDHGVLVPLYYLNTTMPDLPIVSISIDYSGFDEHYALGMAIQRASNFIPEKVALVASGDLSHRLIPGAPAGYDPRAVDFDAKIEEIFDTGYFDELPKLDPSLIEAAGECGLRSIYALAGVFNGLEIKTKVLSYEGPFGVGYMVAEVHPGKPSPERDLYTTQIEHLPQKTELEASEPVQLAMYSLQQYFKQGHPVDPPADTPAELLNRRAGAFVCLKLDGELRGCVGTIEPAQGSLAEEIMTNAVQAATADPRFFPVLANEVARLQFSVDILEEPEPVHAESQLDPKVYGIIVKQGYRTGLLLPDIEGVDSADQQIGIAKQKAGIAPDESVELYRFKVTRYE
ncbi:MAG: AmmeMemoRadiSam system protein A [Candidatus Aquicultor sp.]